MLCFVFQVLADKVHIKALTIAQRVSLLQQGLRDTSGNGGFCASVCETFTFTLTNQIFVSKKTSWTYFYYHGILQFSEPTTTS